MDNTPNWLKSKTKLDIYGANKRVLIVYARDTWEYDAMLGIATPSIYRLHLTYQGRPRRVASLYWTGKRWLASLTRYSNASSSEWLSMEQVMTHECINEFDLRNPPLRRIERLALLTMED